MITQDNAFEHTIPRYNVTTVFLPKPTVLSHKSKIDQNQPIKEVWEAHQRSTRKISRKRDCHETQSELIWVSLHIVWIGFSICQFCTTNHRYTSCSVCLAYPFGVLGIYTYQFGPAGKIKNLRRTQGLNPLPWQQSKERPWLTIWPYPQLTLEIKSSVLNLYNKQLFYIF